VKRPCHGLSFADLANGDIPPGAATTERPIWDIAFCSFALHLVPSSGELFNLLYELSSKVEWLIVIAPHKKPEVGSHHLPSVTDDRSKMGGGGSDGTLLAGQKQ